MPTIFIFLGFKFSFFSNDHEPIHIHVTKGGSHAKFNILPDVKLDKNDGFKKSELKMIEALIEENKEIIIERWNNFFNQ
jgi:hypothetical protein